MTIQKYHVCKNLATRYETPTSNFKIYIKDFKNLVDTYTSFTLSFDTGLTYAGNTLYLNANTNIVLGYVSGTGHITKSFTLNDEKIEAIKAATNPYISIYVNGADMSSNTKVMINTGLTALPYEPYSDSVWHNITPQQYINSEFVDLTSNPSQYSGGSW